jgi:hypothetical protein
VAFTVDATDQSYEKPKDPLAFVKTFGRVTHLGKWVDAMLHGQLDACRAIARLGMARLTWHQGYDRVMIGLKVGQAQFDAMTPAERAEIETSPLGKKFVGAARLRAAGLAAVPEEADPMLSAEAILLPTLAASGVKLFRPRADECAAMNAVDVGIPFADYRQPFPCFAVEFPPAFRETLRFHDTMCKESAVPVGVFAIHQAAERILFFTVISDNGYAMPVLSCATRDEDTVEDMVTERPGFVTDGGLSPEEERVRYVASRVAVNACLLLTHFGYESAGPADPARAAWLADRVRNAKKVKPEVREENRRKLALMPEVFRFTQDVSLYDRADDPREPATPTGRRVTPHHRRGHWAMMACGVGRAERRRTFRRPTFVNAELFKGHPGDTRVNYLTPN